MWTTIRLSWHFLKTSYKIALNSRPMEKYHPSCTTSEIRDADKPYKDPMLAAHRGFIVGVLWPDMSYVLVLTQQLIEKYR